MTTGPNGRGAPSGWRTSEFWLAVAALALPILDSMADGIGRAAVPPGDADDVAGWGRAVGAAVIAGAYAIGRAWVKARTVQAGAPAPVQAPPTVLTLPAAPAADGGRRRGPATPEPGGRRAYDPPACGGEWSDLGRLDGELLRLDAERERLEAMRAAALANGAAPDDAADVAESPRPGASGGA